MTNAKINLARLRDFLVKTKEYGIELNVLLGGLVNFHLIIN